MTTPWWIEMEAAGRAAREQQAKIENRACDSCGKVAPSAEEAEAHGWFLDTVLTVTDDGRTVVETETRCPVCW